MNIIFVTYEIFCNRTQKKLCMKWKRLCLSLIFFFQQTKIHADFVALPETNTGKRYFPGHQLLYEKDTCPLRKSGDSFCSLWSLYSFYRCRNKSVFFCLVWIWKVFVLWKICAIFLCPNWAAIHLETRIVLSSTTWIRSFITCNKHVHFHLGIHKRHSSVALVKYENNKIV